MSKKEQILDTALRLFVEQGIENTPTAQISKAAGVATGTLFHHFRNKEELINALVLKIKEDLVRNLTKSIEGASDFKTQIQNIWTAYINWTLENPAGFQFKTQLENAAQIDDQTRAEIDSMFSGLSELILSGRKNGIFKNIPEDYLITLIESQTNVAAQYFLAHGDRFEDSSLRRLYFAALWDAITI